MTASPGDPPEPQVTAGPNDPPEPPATAGPGDPPLDEFTSRVLDVVDSIPPGRVMSYGDIAEYLGVGLGPRQVGRVMSRYGGAVAWWRVIHSDGTPAPGHDSRALEHYLAESTPLRSARLPVRVDIRRARWPGQPSSGRGASQPPTRPPSCPNRPGNVGGICWNRQ
jgi:alkylated DNA nucleotide flippase Atl1